jgi:hypothetical protein
MLILTHLWSAKVADVHLPGCMLILTHLWSTKTTDVHFTDTYLGVC